MQKECKSESKKRKLKEQEHKEVKASGGRKRENLPRRVTPFIGVVKRTYFGTPTIQSTSSGRPIQRRANNKKVKGQAGLH
jgi:hypothetical protein